MNSVASSLSISIPVPSPTIRSRRSGVIARWFGLKHHRGAEASSLSVSSIQELSLMLPSQGQIMLISGASGSGKSSLLRQIQAHLADRSRHLLIELNSIPLPEKPVVDCFDSQLSLDEVLHLLSRVGLAEAWTYLRTPAELSEGQRWRLRLGIAISLARSEARSEHPRHPVLICDEFAAVLDRVTAAVVSHALRRAISPESGISAVLATSHEDLRDALRPDRIVRCDFGKPQVEISTPGRAVAEQGTTAGQNASAADSHG